MSESDEEATQRLLNELGQAMRIRGVSGNGFAALAGFAAFMGALVVFAGIGKWMTRTAAAFVAAYALSEGFRIWFLTILGLN